MAAAARRGSREASHAHAAVGAKQEESARGNGKAAYAIDFLTGKIGLGSHVLVALNRCLAPSQVGRVVAAFKAGASLARGLEVRGRQPAELVRDPRFGWMAVVQKPAEAAPHATPDGTALAEKLAAAVIAEVTDGGRSAKVLIEAVEVARRNHVASALCARLRNTPHPQHGNCFNALLALTGSEGSVALEHLVEGALDREGVDVAPDAAVAKLSAHDKLWRAAKYGGIDALGETVHQLLEMLPGLAVFWAASHVTPLGPLLDLLGLGMLGVAAVSGVEELLTFRTMAEEARTEADLKAAGAHFAKGVVTLGLTGLFALIGWRQRRAHDNAGMRLRSETERAPPGSAPTEHGTARPDATMMPPQHETAAAPQPTDQPSTGTNATETATSHPPAGESAYGAKRDGQHTHTPTQNRAPAEKSERMTKPRVDEAVEGHAESVGAAVPHGWKILRDTLEFDPMTGHPTAVTEVQDPNGGTSLFIRSYDPVEHVLVMDQAFLDPKAPRWLQHDGTMMTPQGTPSQSFWTMRQIRRLRLSAAEVKTVKMSNIQNSRTILQLAKAKRDGVDLGIALKTVASVKYASTPLIQLGMDPVAGTVRLSGGGSMPIGDLMQYQVNNGRADPAANTALLNEFGFKATDVLDFGFDITFAVSGSRGPKKAP